LLALDTALTALVLAVVMPPPLLPLVAVVVVTLEATVEKARVSFSNCAGRNDSEMETK